MAHKKRFFARISAKLTLEERRMVESRAHEHQMLPRFARYGNVIPANRSCLHYYFDERDGIATYWVEARSPEKARSYFEVIFKGIIDRKPEIIKLHPNHL